MSLHNKERHPLHNTDEIRTALILYGLPSDKPSQLSDAFRCGYIFRDMQPDTYRLVGLLDDHIDSEPSNIQEAVAMRDKLKGHKI